MKVILTSSLGGSSKADGRRVPSILMEENGLLDRIKSIWTENARIVMICASPNDYEKNDSVYSCLKEAFPMSGLSISDFELCDNRNREIIDPLGEMDVIILSGGHVPTQNLFIKQLNLKDKIQDFGGLVIAWSAGSMNCAETVYACPELEGEAISPDYQRWISGLGLTKVNILPHFQVLKEETLDGLRLIEDIAYADSIGHKLIALNDGSYIVIDGEVETLYGEAYSIMDRCQKQICRKGESITLKRLNSCNSFRH